MCDTKHPNYDTFNNLLFSSTLAWEIPWMEEPRGLQSMGLLRAWHDWATSLSLFTFHFHVLEKEMATHSRVLAWRIPGMGESGGLLSMGSHRVGHDWQLSSSSSSSYLVLNAIIIIGCHNISFSYFIIGENWIKKKSLLWIISKKTQRNNLL